MNASVIRRPLVGSIAHPNELDCKRIERALAARKRYRYVSANVKQVRGGYLIESCCCSRNIDKDGGVIHVALIHYDTVSRTWKLFRKNHARGIWEFYSIYPRLNSAIDDLNTDSERLFWQ
ncbi:hypothetical protein ACFIOY_18230 [Bradyrhizobium sp. TZ2]